MAVLSVILLSKQEKVHGTDRLVEAAGDRTDLELLHIDPHELILGNGPGMPGIRHAKAALPDPRSSLLLPRSGSLTDEYSLFCLEQLEACGYRSLNPVAGIWQLRSKFRAQQLLQEAGLRAPESVLLHSRSEECLEDIVAELGGLPVVLKYLRGSRGRGVMKISDMDTIRSILASLNMLKFDLMLQRFHPEAAAGSIRVIVLNGVAHCAMELRSGEGRSRSNLHEGGTPHLKELDGPLRRTAELAASCFGLGFAGVDIVETAEGLLVLEVNSGPGFRGMEEVHGQVVAESIISACQELARSWG